VEPVDRRLVHALVVALWLLAVPLAGQQLFPGEVYSIEATSIRAADVNGDGFADMVTVSPGDDVVSLLFGSGNGRFDTGPILPVGTYPQGLAVDDLDANGWPDIVTANTASDDVTVLLGVGAGDFAPAATFGAGSDPWAVIAGDFNGDGMVDLATANYSSDDVSVLLGDGSGQFAPAIHSPALDRPIGLAAGDLDGDGALDLVVDVSDSLRSLAVLSGDGSGGFSAPVGLSVGPATSLAIADLNADGIPDLATCDFNSKSAAVHLGTGTGSFAPPSTHGVLHDACNVFCEDYDGDGLLDVLTANYVEYSYYIGSVSLLRATAPGQFAPATLLPTGRNAVSIAFADLQGDALLDLMVATQGGVTVLLSDGAGSFATSVFKPAYGGPGLVLEDLDLDGLADIVMSGNDIQIFAGAALPGGAPMLLTAGSPPFDVAFGDFDANGAPDIVTANNGSDDATVLFGDGTGQFPSSTTLLAGPAPVDVATGDVNADGAPDIVVAGSSGFAWVMVNLGGGGFAPAATHTISKEAFALALADVNADGALDVVTARTRPDPPYNSNVNVLPGDGAGNFGAQLVTGLDPGQEFVEVEDVDGDGFPDLVTSPPARIRLGDGSGFFGPETVDLPGITAIDGLADANGDGRRDIFELVKIHVADGVGGFSPPIRFAVGEYPFAAATGDIDGDGAPDLVVANDGSKGASTLSLLIGQSPAFAWKTAGPGLSGTHGTPTLTGQGALAAGNVVALALDNALANSMAALVIGVSVVNLPWKGGVFVPHTDIVFPALATGPQGTFELSSEWPAFVPPGFQVFFQMWIVDPAAAQGWSASNATVCTSP
jgi:hypothetical protein